MSDQVMAGEAAVDVLRRRDFFLGLMREARKKGDIIQAGVFAKGVRLVCYLWDLPIPDEARGGPV